MRRAVADHGALLMNVIASIEGDTGRLLWSIRNSLAEHFAEVHAIVVGDLGNPNSIQNFMLLALPMPRPNILSAGHELAAFRHQLVPPNSSTPPLRDEFAPVERYALPLARPIL